jgi:hypothetical protein
MQKADHQSPAATTTTAAAAAAAAATTTAAAAAAAAATTTTAAAAAAAAADVGHPGANQVCVPLLAGQPQPPVAAGVGSGGN